MPPAFGTKEHWDAEYGDPDGDESYDWLLTFAEVADFVEQSLGGDKSKLIVHLGSGNSQFPEDMWKLGYKRQIATDISEVCCENMRTRYKKLGISHKELFFCAADCRDLLEGIKLKTATGADNPGETLVDRCCLHIDELPVVSSDNAEMETKNQAVKASLRQKNNNGSEEHEDATLNQLLFPDDSYDMVLEKSAMDAMFCDDGDHASAIMQYLREVHRILKADTGVFFIVSMHKPHEVERYLRLKCFGWRVRHIAMEDASSRPMGDENSCTTSGDRPPRRKNYHYCFICTKLDKSILPREWDAVYAEVMKEPDVDPPKYLMVPADDAA